MFPRRVGYLIYSIFSTVSSPLTLVCKYLSGTWPTFSLRLYDAPCKRSMRALPLPSRMMMHSWLVFADFLTGKHSQKSDFFFGGEYPTWSLDQPGFRRPHIFDTCICTYVNMCVYIYVYVGHPQLTRHLTIQFSSKLTFENFYRTLPEICDHRPRLPSQCSKYKRVSYPLLIRRVHRLSKTHLVQFSRKSALR